MSDFVRNLLAERIGGAGFGLDGKIYKFAKIKMAKTRALEKDPNAWIIDLGVGEPDEPADELVVAELAKEAPKAENRWYADNGIPEFQNAALKYMEDVFGLSGLSASQINHSIGSKSALSILPKALINTDDYVLMTIPGYPVFGTHSGYLGGKVHNLELKKENGFLPDLKSIPKEILEKAKVLVLNYPNNPTGALATKEFYEEVVAFAKEYHIVVVSDAAYSTLVFDGKPLSFLSIPGAMDVGIELHSLSKSFNMTGWRIGFCVGNELLVKAFASVKDNSDSGQFRAIQKAGALALANPQITERLCEKYNRRLTKLAGLFSKHGFDATPSPGTFFMVFEAAKGTKNGDRFANGEECSQFLIENCHISTVPWDDVGHYLRLSATFEIPEGKSEEDVYQEIDQRLAEVSFTF